MLELAPYSPERYIEAIKECEDAGYDVVIVDSLSQEWNGKEVVLKGRINLVVGFRSGQVTPHTQSLLNLFLNLSVISLL